MKPDDDPHQAILDFARSLRNIEQRAALQYGPEVDDILRTGSRDAQHIERTLDGLLDFCGHPRAGVGQWHALAAAQAVARHALQIRGTAA